MQRIRTLTLKRKTIPVSKTLPKAIALTAYAGETDRQQALAAGFQMHLAKPIEPEKLISAIIHLLQETT